MDMRAAPQAARIATLEVEIERTRAHHAKAADHRKLADTLFRTSGSD